MNIKQKLTTIFGVLKSKGVSGVAKLIISKFDGANRNTKRRKILSQNSLSDRFSEIYRLGYWKTGKNNESASGEGSTKARSAQYFQELQVLLSQFAQEAARPINFFDAPCGDLNWIHEIFARRDVRYHGADIVSSLISKNKDEFVGEDITLSVFDITKDAFPVADIWHCRDCFFHLSYVNIFRSLENFVRSDIPHALFTNHEMESAYRNRDIDDGDFRFLDLTKPPFHFPQPDAILNDGGGNANDPTRIVGLYTKETIKRILDDRAVRAAT